MDCNQSTCLPPEILRHIFGYLTGQSLLDSRQVSQLWRDVITSLPHFHAQFRLRMTDGTAANRLANNPHSRWALQLQYRTFVCIGINWSPSECFSLPFNENVRGLVIECCCRTRGGWCADLARSCILNFDGWKAYTRLEQFKLLVYPAPYIRTENREADIVDPFEMDDVGIGWYTSPSPHNWPQRFYFPAAYVPVPEKVETFPLLIHPQIQHCTLIMDTINPDSDFNSWEAYNLTFQELFNMDLMMERISQLTTFTSWFWANSTASILNFEQLMVRALKASLQPQRPQLSSGGLRVFNLYFTPSNPKSPTACPSSGKLELLCALSSAAPDPSCRCYATTSANGSRHEHFSLLREAQLTCGTIINLRAGTRENLMRSLSF